MQVDHNVVGWFEIPVADMDRAVAFYEAVMGYSLNRQKMGPLDMAWFPWVESGIGSPGSLVHHEEFYKPSADGALVYFTAFSGDLSNELSRVAANGGKVLITKTLIAEDYGYMGVFLDTEGNRVALHSRA
ncbi:MAG: VOC family protein [Phaeodactylibacter sp.]|nr:VOC family protein [Phaeodactylibacter sp.]MCB9273511.1 VOC family protein [Lewinellaceae bacterium]